MNVQHDGDEKMQELLREYISKKGLKSSRQRELIADVFFRADSHLRVDDLLDQVRNVDERIGQATVYRTMKLLTECGLAIPHQFGDGHTRYEPLRQGDDEHHDHLICTSCNKIVEFFDARIEDLQEELAAQNGFVLKTHKMELYGLCADCQKLTSA